MSEEEKEIVVKCPNCKKVIDNLSESSIWS